MISCHQYAGCVFLRLYCIFLLWTPLLVEVMGWPPCVKIGNASWAFFSSLPWPKKEILCTPLQREAKCQPHYFLFHSFFRGLFVFFHLVDIYITWNDPGVFFLNGLLPSPIVLLILDRVACSPICDSFAHLGKCSHILFYFFSDLGRSLKACNIPLPKTVARRWRWGYVLVWGCVSPLCSPQHGFLGASAQSDMLWKKCLGLSS